MLCDTQSNPQSFWKHPGIIWKKFFSSNFRPSESIFVMKLTDPLKMAFYEGFQNRKAFSRWKLWHRYHRGSFFGSYCNFLSSEFCLKWFLAEKIHFEIWHRPKSAQLYVFEAIFLYFYMYLSGFWAVPKFKIDFFSKKSF